MKNNRLFGIIYLLLSKETMTANELSEYFEVSTRTIYRDIETLSELNIPIYMSKGKNGGIHLLNNYKLDKTLLTDQEQNQILFSLQGVNKLQIDQDHIYEKLKALFSKEEENWFEVDFSVWEDSEEHKKLFESMKDAIINKKVITFSYFSSYGTKTERKVEPLKLCFKYNSWYLSAYDKNKEDYRFFKIMRMKNLKQLDETFERKTPPSISQTDHQEKKVELVLQIDKSLSYRVYDEFDNEAITKLDNGDFIVTVEFPMSDWIYGYILSFGNHIKVLKPEHLKKEIVEILKESLNNYS